MNGHVFDANVLKNFLATGLIPTLAQLCGGPRSVPATVHNVDLAKLRDSFPRFHHDLPPQQLARYSQRLKRYPQTLLQDDFTVIDVLRGSDAAEQTLLACEIDEGRIDPGEAECLAIAAYRDRIVYSDDYAFKLEVEAINDEVAHCPRCGQPPLPYRPIDVHGTVYLLLAAVDARLLTHSQADGHYQAMRNDLGSRLPEGTLANLRGGPKAW